MRLRKKLRNFIGLVLMAAVLLIMNSCLDLETSLEIARKGTVKATITYILDESFSDYGRGFGSDDPWPLPLTEKDFAFKASLVEGVSLKRYRVKSEEGAEIITATVHADSTEDLGRYLGIPMVMEGDGSGGSLTMDLSVDDILSEDDGFVTDTVRSVIGDSTISFSVKAPSAVTSVSDGEVRGRKAGLEFGLLEALQGEAPDSWVIYW